MIFDDFIRGSVNIKLERPSLYQITEYNLEGLKILLDNSVRMGSGTGTNVITASIHPNIWLGSFLDKHWEKIKYVSGSPIFTILKLMDSKVVAQTYSTITETFINDDELDSFFSTSKWKKFVLFSIIKIADLEKMTISYQMKYSDITEKFEERDNKLKDILK